ncbi:alpha/beta hydrolase [Dactylosporangium sp. AC04546]|uniref:alpha/beta hydrolase n=1 Tax=Dactylosporangium sp. AC04546 TaxID=2862460 RepID=UPI002E7AB640|nr:alpha/beta hydrolase [Dactylosporangium sp. AC04546]WVK86544.1 alpha/beta hydrolase [Dactylosporangium sp. AC04546]
MAPGDTSTSTVLTADGPQIACGKAKVDRHADITYASPTTAGTKVDLKMDVLVPAAEGAQPAVVYLPGGGFANASKEAALDQRTYVAEAGFVVASIQYRTTTNGATYLDAVKDVRSAVRYLRAHAAEYGIDPEHIAVYGESAGGYLAAMVGTTNGVKDFEAGDNLDLSGDVQAVVDKFGPSDLAKIGADFDAAAQQANVRPGNNAARWVFGQGTTKSVTADPAAVKRANPVTYVDPTDPAFLLLHGDDDRLVSPSQTLLVHNALRANGVDTTRYVVKGAGHGDLAFVGDPQSGMLWTTQKVMDPIVNFLTSHLKS